MEVARHVDVAGHVDGDAAGAAFVLIGRVGDDRYAPEGTVGRAVADQVGVVLVAGVLHLSGDHGGAGAAGEVDGPVEATGAVDDAVAHDGVQAEVHLAAAAEDRHPLGVARRVELGHDAVSVETPVDGDRRKCRVGLPVAAAGHVARLARLSDGVDVVVRVDGEAVEQVAPVGAEGVPPLDLAVRVELRQPHLAVLVVGCAGIASGDAYQQLAGARVEVHLDRVGPAADDDAAAVVDDHSASHRVVDAAPGTGPLGVAVGVEFDEVGVEPVLAGGNVEVLDALVEVQVGRLHEHTGDVDVACGVDVDVVAVALGVVSGVAALPLRPTDPFGGPVGGELGHVGHVLAATHAGVDLLGVVHDPRMGPEEPGGVRAAVVAEDAAVDRTVRRVHDAVPLVVAGRVELDDHARLVVAARVDGDLDGRVGVQVGEPAEVAAGDEAAVGGDVDVLGVTPVGAVEDDRHSNVVVRPRLGRRYQGGGAGNDEYRRHGEDLGDQGAHRY